MKLLHLSDLHLGKRVHNFSMLEDQRYLLNEVLKVIGIEKISGVIIAGDVYDKTIPPAEAVALFDEFLVELAKKKQYVFVISGNHDSQERIAFGERLMRKSNVFMSPVYNGVIEPITIEDEYGPICVYLLPFIKPVHVRHFAKDEEGQNVNDYTDALEYVISNMQIDKTKRNILVAHQFVTGAMRSESEEISVGGLDNVESYVFEPFDYVALGHIHNQQNIGNNKIRYCGTMLKYAFSEANHQKSLTILEILEKENIKVKTIPLVPLRDMISIQGTYETLSSQAFLKRIDCNSYIQAILTDEDDIPNAFGKLACIYPNLMQLRYENTRTRSMNEILAREEAVNVSPDVLFREFYEIMNNQPLNKEQEEYILENIEKIWEEDA